MALTLSGAVLCGPMPGSLSSAHAEDPWFRPPGSVGQTPGRAAQQYRPPRQQQNRNRQTQQRQPPTRSWSPFQPLIDLFKPQAPRYAAPSRQRDTAPPRVVRSTPVIEAPTEPRGTVYDTAEAARKDSDGYSQIVLVIGDEYAAPLAQGLADAFVTDRESVAVVGKSEAGSGLGPQSTFDWNIAARQLAATSQANIVVVFAGMNDLRPIDGPTGKAELFDERWLDIYGRRIDEFLLRLKLYGRPVVLVGLPPVEDAAANERNMRLNALLKERVERAGLIYADVIDGFLDEDGKFMMSGPDVDGQRRRLRAADGVGFTRSGGRKLAFFIDKQIDHLLVDPADPAAAALSAVEARPSIVLLTGGISAGSRVLAGAPGEASPSLSQALPPSAAAEASSATSPAGEPEPARVLVSGAPLPTVTGRTDDFSWPAGAPTQPATPAGTPSTAGATTGTPAPTAP
ncbi:SGNH/GDSL hydrolase family protein [Ancylobacter pratisalsi]|uniref:SGNH/GDSL hydrolase family protein n=1 Tax=Ancylobacter pratisalsi TaxID=1745854 RepID=UPI001FEC879A|nr:DUF459 domain-containing protein [Ancylobacter pratisalsi]